MFRTARVAERTSLRNPGVPSDGGISEDSPSPAMSSFFTMEPGGQMGSSQAGGKPDVEYAVTDVIRAALQAAGDGLRLTK